MIDLPKQTPYPWRGSREAIVARVRELKAQGIDVTRQAMRDAKGERHAIVEHAIRTLGLPWPSVLELAGAAPKLGGWPWSGDKDLVAVRVLELREQGLDVAAAAMHGGNREQRALLSHAYRKLGLSWNDVLAAAELHPKIASWPWRNDRDAVIARVRELHNQGVEVSAGDMNHAVGERRALLMHATRKLGIKWPDVLAEIGVAPKSGPRRSPVELAEGLQGLLGDENAG